MRGWANCAHYVFGFWPLFREERGAVFLTLWNPQWSPDVVRAERARTVNSAFCECKVVVTQETTVTLALVQLTRSSLATNYQQVAEWSLEFPLAETFQESLAPGSKPSPRAARHGPRQAPLQASCLSCWETKSNVLSYYGWGTSRGDKRVHWKARQAWTISHKREGTPEGDSHRGAALPLGHLLAFGVVFSSRWTTC